jgi:hypothetical protein
VAVLFPNWKVFNGGSDATLNNRIKEESKWLYSRANKYSRAELGQREEWDGVM